MGCFKRTFLVWGSCDQKSTESGICSAKAAPVGTWVSGSG